MKMEISLQKLSDEPSVSYSGYVVHSNSNPAHQTLLYPFGYFIDEGVKQHSWNLVLSFLFCNARGSDHDLTTSRHVFLPLSYLLGHWSRSWIHLWLSQTMTLLLQMKNWKLRYFIPKVTVPRDRLSDLLTLLSLLDMAGSLHCLHHVTTVYWTCGCAPPGIYLI